MAFYFDEDRRLDWIDQWNIAYQENLPVKNKETGNVEKVWKNISYYPNIEMAFKYFVLKNISDTKITNDFEELLDKMAILLDQYKSLAKRENEVYAQNQEIIRQNEKIIKLKQEILDNQLIEEYNEEEVKDESEGLGWNY